MGLEVRLSYGTAYIVTLGKRINLVRGYAVTGRFDPQENTRGPKLGVGADSGIKERQQESVRRRGGNLRERDVR